MRMNRAIAWRLVVALALVLSACTQNEPAKKSPIPEFDFDEPAPPPAEAPDGGPGKVLPGPPRMGGPSDQTVVGTGLGWRLLANVADSGGTCTNLECEGGISFACGFLIPLPELCAGRFINCTGRVPQGGPYYLHGLVAKRVAEVSVDLGDGRVLTTKPIGADAGFSVNFYVVVISPVRFPSPSRPWMEAAN